MSAALVNKADVARVTKNRTGRRNPGRAPITSAYDFDRDGAVGLSDKQIARRNRTTRRAFLVMF